MAKTNFNEKKYKKNNHKQKLHYIINKILYEIKWNYHSNGFFVVLGNSKLNNPPTKIK